MPKNQQRCKAVDSYSSEYGPALSGLPEAMAFVKNRYSAPVRKKHKLLWYVYKQTRCTEFL